MKKLYKNIGFLAPCDRPYYYLNAAQSLDGKINVISENPIYKRFGSRKDYETMMTLRAHADVLIHGAKTAIEARVTEKLNNQHFWLQRKENCKKNALLYLVFSNNLTDELIDLLQSSTKGIITMLVTTDKTKVPALLLTKTIRIGKNQNNLSELSAYLQKNSYKKILVEGGPKLWHSFFSEGMIDEIFLTIAPKIFGGRNNEIQTLLNGNLLSAKKYQNLKLLSVNKIHNEVFLRYKILKRNKNDDKNY